MYDELVDRMRKKARGFPKAGEVNPLLFEAADAIEELSVEIDTANEANIALYGALPRWISVTERLPKRHKNVLCCGARGGMFVGWFTNISTISDGKTIAYVHGGNGRYVTHWTPLPEPPKEE